MGVRAARPKTGPELSDANREIVSIILRTICYNSNKFRLDRGAGTHSRFLVKCMFSIFSQTAAFRPNRLHPCTLIHGLEKRAPRSYGKDFGGEESSRILTAIGNVWPLIGTNSNNSEEKSI